MVVRLWQFEWQPRLVSSSGVIEYLEKGRVPTDHADFRGHSQYKKALTKMLSHSTDERHYTHGFNVSCLLQLTR